jgi:hypothetical protein
MSSLLRPVGHLPASVYWFRRALVLVVLVVVLVVLVRVIGGGGGDQQNTAATDPAQSPSTQPTVVPTATPTRSGSTTTPTKTSETAKTSEPPKDVKCTGSDVKIDVVPAGRSLAPGAQLSLAIQLSAVGNECKATVDPDRLSVTITSGNDQIWSTTHCAQAIPRATLVLAKGKQSTTTVLWNGRRSGPGCLPGQPQAKPGTYVAKAVYDGRASTEQAFRIV